jgi:hypothetical protein
MSAKKMASKKQSKESLVIPVIEQCIYVIRGQRVILDADLAQLYGVDTGHLNRAVQRNIERFPESFMFQLNDKEFVSLKCQNGIARAWGGRRTVPYAFAEHGAIMAATILRSNEAIQMSIYIVEAFVKLREMMSTNRKLAMKLNELESRIDKQDQNLVSIIDAIQGLLEPEEPNKKKKRIGYVTD